MAHVLLLENPVQHYAWGSHEWIPGLLGQSGSIRPWAELWVGAHPRAPSLAEGRSLDGLISRDPPAILGPDVARHHGGRLPFLVKLLAARVPLSLQAHPNRQQARQGFAREEAAGIPRAAPHRNYRDDNHKPELLVALRPFWGLNGFRPVDEALDLLRVAGLGGIQRQVAAFQARPDPHGLEAFFRAVMTLPAQRQRHVALELVSRAQELGASHPEFPWITRAHQVFGADIGLVSFLLLNLFKLQPGEAMSCRAGALHAYLHGFGVEVMANSDNVLRGGCTPKHVDIPELLRVLDFRPGPATVLRPVTCARHERRYPSFAREFEVHVVELPSRQRWHPSRRQGVEILLCVEGTLEIDDGQRRQRLSPGGAALVPGAVQHYHVSGQGRFFRTTAGQVA